MSLDVCALALEGGDSEVHEGYASEGVNLRRAAACVGAETSLRGYGLGEGRKASKRVKLEWSEWDDLGVGGFRVIDLWGLSSRALGRPGRGVLFGVCFGKGTHSR